MQKTTIAGAFTAFIGLIAALVLVFAHFTIPSEVITLIGMVGIVVIVLFVDLNSIRTVSVGLALILEKSVMVLNYVLSKFYPEITWTPILAFLQPILILIFSYVIQDVNKNAIQPRAPN